MEKPYIEYQNKKYEFEANRKLKKDYDKEIKNMYLSLLSNKNFNQKEIKEMQEFAESHKEITENDIEKNETLKNQLIKYSNIIDNLDVSDINEKYVYLMLNEKYSLTKNEYEKMLDQIENDCGTEWLNSFITKVCEKVFTKLEVKNQTQLPKNNIMN